MAIKTSISVDIKLPSGNKVSLCNVRELDPNFKLSDHIRLCEWANNKSKDAVKMILNPEVAEFAEMVEELRCYYGKPFNFTSGYRTKSYNKQCGGSVNSLHLLCRACDISFPKLDSMTFEIIDKAWEIICKKHGKIGGINRYTNMIHLDNYEDFFGNTSYIHRDYRGSSDDV